MKLPKIKQDMHWSERAANPSVDVLVKVDRIEGLSIGRYFHGIGKWQIVGFHGDWDVVEWWDLPESGTGNKA